MQATITSNLQTSSDTLGSTVGPTVEPLLELALTESSAQGAYVYHLDPQRTSLAPVAWSGLSPQSAEVARSAVRATGVHLGRSAPIVLHENAWTSPAFEAFPEFRTNRFEGVISIPLLDSGKPTGLLNICRSSREAVKPREFSFLLSLSAPIAGLLAASQARLGLAVEVDKLAQQLSDRKILDRAKGLIQSRFDWTEEQAYFCIRNLSRRNRIPMREIAQQIIETGASTIPAEAGRS